MNDPLPYLKLSISMTNNLMLTYVESSDKKCIEIAIHNIKLSREFYETDIRTNATYSTQKTNTTKYVYYFRTKSGTKINEFLRHISRQLKEDFTREGIACLITYDQIMEQQATNKM